MSFGGFGIDPMQGGGYGLALQERRFPTFINRQKRGHSIFGIGTD
jgi:hypothetical protein